MLPTILLANETMAGLGEYAEIIQRNRRLGAAWACRKLREAMELEAAALGESIDVERSKDPLLVSSERLAAMMREHEWLTERAARIGAMQDLEEP